MNDEGDQNPPWWHSAPSEPPVDSVLEEGVKLFAALRDWAVDSGAAETVAQLTATAAATASHYMNSAPEETPEEPEAQPVVRCADCPVCRALDMLDRGNPQLAAQARTAMVGLSGMVAGLLGDHFGDGQANP